MLYYNFIRVIIHKISYEWRHIYMEYLQKVLGLKLTYINDDIKHIPNFIGTRYVLRNVLLDRQKAVFIYPKT